VVWYYKSLRIIIQSLINIIIVEFYDAVIYKWIQNTMVLVDRRLI